VRERVVQAALVGHEHAEQHVGGYIDARKHLGAVGQLRDDVGADEARHLKALQAAGGEAFDEPDLVVGRDAVRLVLKSVAGPDLPDLHALAHDAGRGPDQATALFMSLVSSL